MKQQTKGISRKEIIIGVNQGKQNTNFIFSSNLQVQIRSKTETLEEKKARKKAVKEQNELNANQTAVGTIFGRH